MWQKLKKKKIVILRHKEEQCFAKTKGLIGTSVQTQMLMKGAQEKGPQDTCYFADIWITPYWFSGLFRKPF